VSMRIGSQTEASVVSNARSTETKTSEPATSNGYMPLPALGMDEVSLSGASSLASLAKTLTPADKQAKVAALTSQVRSGQYRADAAQISLSVVQSHLKK